MTTIRKTNNEVADQIEAFVQTNTGTTSNAIARHFDFTTRRANELLSKLRKEGRVRPMLRQGPFMFGESLKWKIGKDPTIDYDQGEAPNRRFIPASKAPLIDRRDPLVSFLFGERGTVASRNANEPRCIACRAPDGKPHGPACVLAMFQLVPTPPLLPAPQRVEVMA